VMAVTTGFFNYFGSAVHAERFALASTQARLLAEAGVDKAVYELNQDANYSGETDTLLGNGAFSVSIASINGNTKRLTVTGVVPNTASPVATKTIQVTVSINSSVVSFRYGIQVGDGGVSMSNGSRVVGNIFSNGNVTGSGTITGDATVAVSAAPIANQQWTVRDSSFNIGDTSAHAAVAQAMRPSVDASLTGIKLNLKKVGSPGDLTVKVVTDHEGDPSRTVLASGTIPASLVTTSAYGFVDVTLASTPTLSANHTYWIIAIAPVSTNNYFVWGRDSAGGYTQGAARYSSNWNSEHSNWNHVTGDLNFMAFLSGLASSLSGVTVQGNAWASTLSNCTIGGSASYQSISSCNVTGTVYPDTAPATPAPLPISDAQIADWEAIALTGGTIPGPYAPSGTVTLGPKKIDGDLSIQNSATLVLTGPIWVNGNVTFSNNAALRVSPSVGSNGAVIIADATGNTALKGIVNLSNNVTINGNGSANSFPMIISTNTSSHAVELSNNAASVILYAPYGSVEVENGAGASQITARKLELENNSSITYVNGLQNASFSNGPGGSWAVVPGTYAITR
ncbi:MAG: choice-of-anchor R domain-containing protein, partial [Candidatus Paceibacterota bacterium]